MKDRDPRQRGPQDPRLEVGAPRNWRTGVKPTTDGDIRPRARIFMRLVDEAVIPTMALEGMRGGKGTQEMVEAQQAHLDKLRHDAIVAGVTVRTFDLRVKLRVEEIKDQAREDEARVKDDRTAELVRSTLTNVNWGNHAKRDPFGL